ncbi:Uncharacterised protein [Blautia glucerasea]|uniref:Uncharacterized protein n=1 Tax=Blautia glucerasea TaxID=536633 RepID=A0A6N2R8N6_9FIRM
MIFHFVKQSGLKSFAQECVVKVFDNAPKAIIRETAFGKETMDMRIPFKWSSKGVKYANETGDEVYAFVEFMKQFQNNTSYSLKQAVEKGTVIKEKLSQVFIKGEDKMPVVAMDEFKSHFRGAVNAVFIAAGRAKFRVTAESNEFKFTAMRASIHGTTIGRIPAVNHLLNVFHNNRARMECIFNFFVMIPKNFLKYIHKIIMKENVLKRNL